MKLESKKGNLIFSGCDTVDLAQKYGTPLYVISEDKIHERCREIKTSFLDKYTNTQAVYASKALLTMAVCKIMEREGLGLDVVSGGELYTALKADFPADKIIFHGNNKSYEELELAIDNGVGRIVVDNLHELSMLEEILARKKKRLKILFRLSPGIEGETHEYIITGQRDSKFGISLDYDRIQDLVKRVINSEFLDLLGFHFHLGSQLFQNNIYVQAINLLMELAHKLNKELGFEMTELNTGGGFGIWYVDGDERKPLKYFVDPIMETIEKLCKTYALPRPTVVIEPGRWIVGEAGITLYTVGSIKEIANIRTYASVDGGLPDNPRPALYDAEYHGVIANKIDQKPNMTVTIAGKCCETGDILIWDLKTPQIETGDILAVLSTGAYNYSMSSNYNRLPRPAMVLLKDGREEIIVRRESYEDLLVKEVIPKRLRE